MGVEDRSQSHALRRALGRATLVAAILLGSVPSLFAGASSAELQQRSREVGSMTAVERARLQRNWETFQKLPDDRKEHFRQLHAGLETDFKSGTKQLHHVLQIYTAWLQTLTPGQRADLRGARSEKEKLELVRKFKADQDSHQESRALRDPEEDEFPRHRWRFLQGKARPFAPGELNSVMNALTELLPPPERDQVEREDDTWSKYRRIVLASAQQAGGPPEWPSTEQQAKMFDAISKSERAGRLKALSNDQQRRRQWAMAIFSSFAAQLLAEAAPFHPQKDQLEQYFDTMSNESREALMQLPTDVMNQELVRRYYVERLRQNPDFSEFSKRQREFQGFTFRFLTEADVYQRPGPGGFHRGGPPPDRRDGPDRDEGPPRGPPGRRPPPRPED